MSDSNRRPPPYHRATRREARATPGSRGHEARAGKENRPKAASRAWTPVPGLVFPPCSLASADAELRRRSSSSGRRHVAGLHLAGVGPGRPRAGSSAESADPRSTMFYAWRTSWASARWGGDSVGRADRVRDPRLIGPTSDPRQFARRVIGASPRASCREQRPSMIRQCGKRKRAPMDRNRRARHDPASSEAGCGSRLVTGWR